MVILSFSNAQFPVLIYLDQTDWQAYRCSFAILLGVGGSTIWRFLGDLRFGFGETCKCWGNFGQMLGTALGFNFRLPKPLIGRKLSGVKWSLQMYMSFFGFQLSRRIALIHFVNRSGLFTGILWKPSLPSIGTAISLAWSHHAEIKKKYLKYLISWKWSLKYKFVPFTTESTIFFQYTKICSEMCFSPWNASLNINTLS